MTRLLIALVSALALMHASSADARSKPRLADPAVLATLQDDPFPLPKHGLPWEQMQWQPRVLAPSSLPSGRVSTPAEYEGMEGIFIRWSTYPSLQTQMIVPLTTADPPAKVWIAVTGASEQNSVANTLSAAGADLDQVVFVTQPCSGGGCSVWMRDYGPRFIIQDGVRAIVDHEYERMPFRFIDNQFPTLVANLWQEPLFHNGLTHGGGNYHSFSNAEAWMTTLIEQTNPGVSASQIADRYAAYQGVELTITPRFPQSSDGTGHIDMWMLPVASDKVIIGEYAANVGGGLPKQISDATALEMSERGYTVYRTPGWTAGAHYTYTNSVIVNQVVLLCSFGGSYATQDAQARAVFEQALPDHDIIPVDCSGIINASGAIHCIVMHVPDVLFRDPFDD